jgi:hypothetical protein
MLVLLLAVAVPYGLLLCGGLSGAVRRIVGTLAARGGASVELYGFRSGVFFATRADSVVVTDDRGLKVFVGDIRIGGSLVSYLLGTGLETVSADSLGILLPRPAPGAEPEEPPESMEPLFESILKGFVTGADTLSILRGRIADYDGTVILDSMSISARVFSGGEARLDVYSAGVFLPGFGRVTGAGGVRLNRERAMLEDFTAEAPAGTLALSGTLRADSTLDILGDGGFTTDFLAGAPAARGHISAALTGTTGDPLLAAAITDGTVSLLNRDFQFCADSLEAGMDGARIRGFTVAGHGISGSLSGEADFLDMTWRGEAEVRFDSLDPSGWDVSAPAGLISGRLSARGEGDGEGVSSASLELGLEQGELSGLVIGWVDLQAAADPSGISGTVSAEAQGLRVSSAWNVSLGESYRPVSWTADGSMEASDLTGLLDYVNPGPDNPSIAGASLRFQGQGSMNRFRISCDAGVEKLALEGTQGTGVFLRGSASGNLTREGMLRLDFQGATGLEHLATPGADLSGVVLEGDLRVGLPPAGRPSLAFSGTASVDTAAGGGLTALAAGAELDLELGSGLPEGNLRLSVPEVRTPVGPVSLGLRAGSRDGSVLVDSLELVHAQGARLVAGLSADMNGDVPELTLDSLRITLNKLRLVRAGGATVNLMEDGTIGVDTIWLDPPSGYISGRGSFSGDGGIEASFQATSVDLAALGLVLGVDLPISGVFSSSIEAGGRPGDLDVSLHAVIDDPTYGSWTQGDSITVDATMSRSELTVDGVWIWSQGIRSGVTFAMDNIWNGTELDLSMERLTALEMELTGIGDWLLYILPFPVMTSGASISSRIEYHRDQGYLSAGVAGHFQRFFLAGAQLEFPMSSIYVSYPDTRENDDYNGTFQITSGQGRVPALSAELRARVRENVPLRNGVPPVSLEGYSFRAVLNRWETIINGMGWVSLSGSLTASSDDPARRPMIRGKISLDQGVIALQGEQSAQGNGESGGEAEIPVDLYIIVQAERGLWLRNSYMNIELAADITVLTQDGRPVFTGSISVVRGTINVLNKDFRITQGSVEIIQGTPPSFMVNFTAEARVRSSMSREVYTIEVNVTGDPANPEIAMSGTGVSGDLTDEDIITLLTLGMTYGEMQQMDSGALGNELESVTQGMLGNMLARSVREGMGLDALSISPDLLSDTTGLTVEVGKYVLPHLYVSYMDDVFSPKPGTISAQYFFSRDLYLEGSSKTTLTGNQEPAMELHYTIRY